MSSTFGMTLHISEYDIYNKLSDKDKKMFNKVIITDVKKDEVIGGVTIYCAVVNDCHKGEIDTCEEVRCKLLSERIRPYKRR